MAEKYISLFKGTPENQVNMSIANEVDWSSFASSTWQDVEVTIDSAHKPRVCHGGLDSSQILRYKTTLDGLGLKKRPEEGFSLITDGSVYDVLMTSNDRAQATNRTMTAIPVGTKPDDWDENYAIKYYVQSTPSGDVRQPVYAPAKAPWSSSTQYYTSDYASWWYVKSGDNMLRFGVGDIGLTSQGFPSVGVLNNTTNFDNATQSPMFWTWLHDNTETIIKNNNVNDNYNFASFDSASFGMPGGLFNNGQRNRYLFSTTYAENNRYWNTGYSGQDGAANRLQWRTDCRNKVKIRNKTCTQFGFVTQNGHRYFGIWVLVPTIANMIGFNKYANDAEGIPTSLDPTPISPDPHAYDDDLRIYNFDDPIPDTQAPQYISIHFYGVEIDKIGITIEEKEGQRPPDTNPDLTPSNSWKPLTPVLPTQRSLGSLAKANEHGFHVYKIYKDDWKSFVSNLWNWGSLGNSLSQQVQEKGFIDNILAAFDINSAASLVTGTISNWLQQSKIDPLSAIQTCMALPGYINVQVQAENDVGHIKIAGMEQAQSAYCCGHETYIETYEIPTNDLPVTASYLDVAPFSTCEIYLPYIGTIQLNPADCVGSGENGKIVVTYSTCVVDGTISATVECYSGYASKNPAQYGPFIGNAAYRIPIAQKDANAFSREAGYLSALGTGMSGIFNVVKSSLGTLATNPRNQDAIMQQGISNIGTYANAAGSMIGQAMNSYLLPQTMRGSTLGTGSAIVCSTNEIYVLMTTPWTVHSGKEDMMLKGSASGKIRKISENSGFCTYTYANLQGITATAAEIEDIRSILQGGVYQ